MDYQTVTIRSVTTTDDGLGNTTETTTEQAVERVLFEPQQATERTDRNSPGVVTPAKFYGPFPPLDADDLIVDAAGVSWQVVGGAAKWGAESEVPVKRASAV
jgi:hypothetical protein